MWSEASKYHCSLWMVGYQAVAQRHYHRLRRGIVGKIEKSISVIATGDGLI